MWVSVLVHSGVTINVMSFVYCSFPAVHLHQSHCSLLLVTLGRLGACTMYIVYENV